MRAKDMIIPVFTALFCARAHAASPVNLSHGGFEQWRADGTPEGWAWGVSRDAKASIARDDQVRREGKTSARLSSRSPYGPHVYGGVQQQLTGLEPRSSYRIRMWVKGQEVGDCWFGGGPGWQTRTLLPTGSYDWQRAECIFFTGDDERSWDLRINVDSPTKALWVDEVTVERFGPEEAKAINDRLDAVGAKLPAVKDLLEQARARRIPVDYPEVKLAVVERFIGYGHDDVKHGRFSRAEQVADHLERLLEEARHQLSEAVTGKRAQPAVPRFRTGKVDVVDWHFEADTEVPSTGRRQRRPVFFNGYGHFNQVVTDLPDFHRLGANIIQIERGPSSTVKPDLSVDMSEFDSHVLGALKKAAEHNVMICLLTSPHYFPQWAYEKWPHLVGVTGGFIRFAIDPPESRQVHEAHLKAVAGRIKDAPALHSVCLSNEPIYIDSRKDKATQRMWPDYLKERHATIGRLNERYGSQYGSFEDVSIPPPHLPNTPKTADKDSQARYRTERAKLYDWVRFNNRRFSGWHQWMGQVVHAVAPEIRVHAKIMTTIWDRNHILYGVDPEQFSRISDLNGNDSYNMMNRSADSPYICSWRDQTMFYELQASMRRAPVVNTEDHLIVDRERSPIPPGHTYTVLWQAAVHRLGASMIWVWERTYDCKSDFEGSILHRPENVEAAGRAHLDLMRLSEQVVAIQNAPRPVGLLYSVTAIVPNGDYLFNLCRVYEALNFAGIPMQFISEDQLKNGHWNGVKVLIVPLAVNSPPGLREAARRFAASGGRLVMMGNDCLSRDEYGHPLRDATDKIPQASPIDPVGEKESTTALRSRLVKELAAAQVIPTVVLTGPDGEPVFGIEWHAARHNERLVVSLVNLTRKPIRFGLTAQGVRAQAACDLIALRDVRLPAESKPLEPMLLELR